MEDQRVRIKHNFKIAQDRKKCYADQNSIEKQFQVGDHVLFKVKQEKSTLNMGNCSKLAARYCGPFQILEKIGPVDYELSLPPRIKVCNVFHVSLLKIYLHDPRNIIDQNMIQV